MINTSHIIINEILFELVYKDSQSYGSRVESLYVLLLFSIAKREPIEHSEIHTLEDQEHNQASALYDLMDSDKFHKDQSLKN